MDPNVLIPGIIEKRQQPTWVVGFGAAVRELCAEGDVDHEHAAREAEQWTFSDAYSAGFMAGADWYRTLHHTPRTMTYEQRDEAFTKAIGIAPGETLKIDISDLEEAGE